MGKKAEEMKELMNRLNGDFKNTAPSALPNNASMELSLGAELIKKELVRKRIVFKKNTDYHSL